MKKTSFAIASSFTALSIILAAMSYADTASDVNVKINYLRSGPTINRNIFGQFAEHLGEGIYGGIWVGNDSSIPNVRGIRSDVVEALRAIKVPVVRWPGGCFADEYNWRDGIGPADKRVSTVNLWGNVIEPNTFGTHEFMDFVEQINSEAYISVNVGSAPASEAADWLEYMTTDLPSTLGKLRAENGRPAPYRLRYLGIGNETWGCGGSLSADAYVTEMKRFATFARNLNPAQRGPMPWIRSPDAMERIAVGPDSGKTEYTEAVMKAIADQPDIGWQIEGLSLHYYSFGINGIFDSPSTDFNETEYAGLLKNTLKIDTFIKKHSAIMDKYDPKKRVSLVVDEWGAWLTPLENTNPMFLRQQNSLRDAILASLNLNIFSRHADRIRMANVAQMVNVIQALILTEKEKMLLTPTYHIFDMYVPFQDATLIPATYSAGKYTEGDIVLPAVDLIAAKDKQGRVWVAVTNLDPVNSTRLNLDLVGFNAESAVGRILTSPSVDDINTFDLPATVQPKPFESRSSKQKLSLVVPPKSVLVVELR